MAGRRSQGRQEQAEPIIQLVAKMRDRSSCHSLWTRSSLVTPEIMREAEVSQGDANLPNNAGSAYQKHCWKVPECTLWKNIEGRKDKTRMQAG